MKKLQVERSKIFLTILTFLSAYLASNYAIAGTVLVSNVLSNSVSFINETTLQTVKETKVGYMPHEIIVTKDGKTALVSNFGDLLNVIAGYSITSLDVSNGKVLQTITLPKGSRPHGLAFFSDSQVLVTAQGMQSLLVIDYISGKINKTIPLPGAGAHMVLVDAEQHFAYVANTDSGSVCKINLKNFTVENEVKIGKEAEGLALTTGEDLLLVTDRKDNYVAVLKTKDLTIQNKIQTEHGPVRVVMFNQGQAALVTNTISGNAQVIDIASLSINKKFNTTLSKSPLPVPINIAVQEDQKSAYVTNSFACDITLVDLIKGEVLKTFNAGYMPDGVAISQVTTVNIDSSIYYETFSAAPIEINANIENVWQVVKNVEEYNRISHGAVTAHVDGPIAPGKNILLQLYKDKCVGQLIPKSNEIITVVDDEHKILSWIRKLPDGEYTERYQLLEKISENKTRSSIVVRIPGLLGKITKQTFGKVINDALQELNDGVKAESEHTA